MYNGNGNIIAEYSVNVGGTEELCYVERQRTVSCFPIQKVRMC